jgi:hypothetical protein
MSDIKLVRDIASKMLDAYDKPCPWYIAVPLALQIIKALHRRFKERDAFKGPIGIPVPQR